MRSHTAPVLIPGDETMRVIDIRATVAGAVCAVEVEPGDRIDANTNVVVLEAMKMEYEIKCLVGGVVDSMHAKVGDVVSEGMLLARIRAEG